MWVVLAHRSWMGGVHSGSESVWREKSRTLLWGIQILKHKAGAGWGRMNKGDYKGETRGIKWKLASGYFWMEHNGLGQSHYHSLLWQWLVFTGQVPWNSNPGWRYVCKVFIGDNFEDQHQYRLKDQDCTDRWLELKRVSIISLSPYWALLLGWSFRASPPLRQGTSKWCSGKEFTCRCRRRRRSRFNP